MSEPYSREWSEEQIDALLPDLAQAVEAWLNRDREDWRSSNHAAGRIELVLRSLSGHTNNIRSIDSRERWWGVNARRD